MYAVWTGGGTLRWAYATGGDVRSSPALGSSGASTANLYIGSDDFKIYCLQSDTGALVWSYTTGSSIRSSPTISSDGAMIFVGSWDYKI